MAKTIQFKRGTTAQTNLFVGALGEVTVDTDKDVIVVHDGSTQGGFANAARANADGSVSILSKTGTVLGSVDSAGGLTTTRVRASGAGTAAAPSVQVGNPDNGLYAPTTDAVATSTNGVNRFQIDGTGIQKSTIGTGTLLYEDFVCRAWINFNGTGTIAIRASGNVSSITDVGLGTYTVNLAVALPDTLFGIAAAGGRYGDGRLIAVQGPNCYAPTTSTISVVTGSDSTSLADMQDIYLTVFR